jgi:hypothetical protein
VCIADGDRLIPLKPALKVAHDAPRGELRRYPFGHFGMYFGDGFERGAADQAEFLRRHLLRQGAAYAASTSAKRTLEALP